MCPRRYGSSQSPADKSFFKRMAAPHRNCLCSAQQNAHEIQLCEESKKYNRRGASTPALQVQAHLRTPVPAITSTGCTEPSSSESPSPQRWGRTLLLLRDLLSLYSPPPGERGPGEDKLNSPQSLFHQVGLGRSAGAISGAGCHCHRWVTSTPTVSEQTPQRGNLNTFFLFTQRLPPNGEGIPTAPSKTITVATRHGPGTPAIVAKPPPPPPPRQPLSFCGGEGYRNAVPCQRSHPTARARRQGAPWRRTPLCRRTAGGGPCRPRRVPPPPTSPRPPFPSAPEERHR